MSMTRLEVRAVSGIVSWRWRWVNYWWQTVLNYIPMIATVLIGLDW